MIRRPFRPGPIAAAVLIVLSLTACGSGDRRAAWPLPNADLAGTRAAEGSTIDTRNVSSLRARWRLRFTARPSFSGIFASTPVSDGRTVFVEDLQSTVFALDRDTGAVRWRRPFHAVNDGPNGLALDGGRVFGATDSDAFALAKSTGKLLWRRHLTNRAEQFVDIAPVPWQGLVFLSTVGYQPYGRGAIYALDAATGAVRWRFVTVEHPWPHPLEAGGGGLWYPVTVDDDGRLYAGNSNPTPWGGTPELPNGGAFPGPVRYTDSLIVLDARTGRLLWFDQVTPHDVRDHDFEATPILAHVGGADLVFGAGKAGLVVAWDRRAKQRVWQTRVGLHLNDTGPLPRRRVTICPGLLGGVETPMAFADGRLFVPVVDLCAVGSAVTRQPVTAADPSRGRGRLVALEAATGHVLWQAHFSSPSFGCATVSNDVVFTSTYDGTVYGLRADDGKVLWRVRMGAGVNGCPAVVGDLLLVGSGLRRLGGPLPALVAYGPS